MPGAAAHAGDDARAVGRIQSVAGADGAGGGGPSLEAAGVIVHEAGRRRSVIGETIHAAARLAFGSYRPVAVLIGQRAVGFKDWTR